MTPLDHVAYAHARACVERATDAPPLAAVMDALRDAHRRLGLATCPGAPAVRRELARRFLPIAPHDTHEVP